MEKSNPLHPGFTTMKLYLLKHVKEKSFSRFGGEEGLDKEKRKRDKTKWDETLRKTKKVFARDEH
jgi:hypothetical protein